MASVVDLKSKEEKDAELDRKIEALRKKNEALMKRHKLIEEDRKRAEQEGNAITTSRKNKIPDGEPDKARKEKENFSITLDVSAGEKRTVSEGKSPRGSHTPTHAETSPRSPTQRTSGRTGAYSGGRSPHFDRSGEAFKFDDDDNLHPPERPARGRRRQSEEGPKRAPRMAKEGLPVDQWASSPRGGRGPGRGRGGGTPGRGGGHSVSTEVPSGPDRKVKEWEEKRKQNIEKMNEEMEKIAEYERSQRDGVREKNPIRNFLDDPRRTGPIAEVDRKEGSRRHNRNWGGPDFEKVKTGMDREKESHVRRPGGKNQMDMTMSMTGRERAEYVRWKQEREQIDQERLARHRKPTGQWRREWDAEKTDTMFKDGPAPNVEDEPMGRRDRDKRVAPKPPTMAEFLPKSLQSSGEKRDQKRGRGRNKPYSMHDSRWEEDEDEVNEKDKMLSVEEKEKETHAEESEEKKVEGAQKNTSKAPKLTVDEKKDEPKHDKEEEEEYEEDDEEWTDASGDDEEAAADEDGSEVEEDSIEEASPASPKEQRLPRQMETPKLTMPPPNVNNDEGALEIKPTSPFSPDGHRPVTDWGEEMEMLSPPGSSNEDSPPQVVNRKVFTMESNSHSESTQNPILNPQEASNVESSSLQSPVVQADSKLEPLEESSGGEPLPGAPVLSQERDPNSNKNQGDRVEEILAAPAQTTLSVEEASSVQEQSTPVKGQSSLVQEQSTPVKEQGSPAQKQSSPVQEQSSPIQEQSSPAQEQSSPVGEQSSQVQEHSPPAREQSSPTREQSSPAQEQSSPVREQSSPVREQSSPVEDQCSSSTEEAPLVKDEITPPAEDLEGTIKAVHIADFETSTEVPQSS